MKLEKPKFIIKKSIAVSQYNKVKESADIVSYSSKTNPTVTSILEENTNAMFSVHTVNELINIKDKSRAMFLAQGWDEKTILELTKQKIKWFVVDNEVDLDTLLNTIKKNQSFPKINLLLRMKLKENSIRTEKYYVFGIEVKKLVQRINEISEDKELKNKIENIGIHFHRKTQNLSEWKLKYEFEDLFSNGTLDKISYVCIGGGLPSVYADTNIKVIDPIFNKIKDFKDWLNEKDIKLINEPGRFIAAPAVELESSIIAIHGNTIIVNSSVYSGDLDALVVPVKLLVKDEHEKSELSENENLQTYVIKGMTPCSMDIYRYRVYLDKNNIKVGNKITFINAGAYNFASEFCNLEKIQEIIIE